MCRQNKFEEERKQFPLAEKYAYFETGATGLIPTYVYEAVKKYQDDRYLVGGDANWNGKGTLAMMQDSKHLLAQMICATADDIAFGQSSSQMFTLFTEGIGLQAGDNIIITDNAWLGTRFAAQTHETSGVEVRYIPTENGIMKLQSLVDLVDTHTKAVAISFVESHSGFKQDLAEIGAFCDEKEIWFAVDAVQGMGVLPIDVQKMQIDFLVGNDYKWMMHYCGTGFAYISKELRNVLKPWGAGWMSDDERFNTGKKQLSMREDAGRYELGYPNVAGIYALGLVAQRYLKLGKENIEIYVLALQDYLEKNVATIPGACMGAYYPQKNKSSISNILLDDRFDLQPSTLKKNGVFLDVRDGAPYNKKYYMRVAIHYFNNTNDIDRLLNVIKARAK